MANKPNGRPANPKSKYFLRILKPAEKKILVHAGRGDMSAGFHHVLETYVVLWNKGFRPTKDFDCIRVSKDADAEFDSVVDDPSAFERHS